VENLPQRAVEIGKMAHGIWKKIANWKTVVPSNNHIDY